ncbi:MULTISPECIES: methylenetetrahydrofolate reductase [unclassified Brevibacterium]|uniref:methylenetetrahydrofolate reductase n=1 Tax=unclassified Brevibacterium TaxID=2614124 RepID=UPI001091C93C|nr:methylenetetrahydrofolate reductase [Brevibacterium sp. S22]TGD30441.1 methylenetetrahydrofolate reductase [Brevibacterium sp. S22]
MSITTAIPRISASAPDSAAELHPPSRRRLRRALSFEVIPPRSEKQAARLPGLLRFLDSLTPDYLAVTSSANSGWLQGTADFIADITATTSLRPLAHLTCTASTEAELLPWIDHLLGVGVRGFLAIRGDFPDREASLPPGHLPHADALVQLLRTVETDNVARLAAGRLGIGVAAYPSGHPESTGPEEDLDVLAAKQRNGADFAITQLFFDPNAYARLRRRAEHAGITIPIIPGILPITDLKRLHTMGRLSGLPVPDHLIARFDHAGDAAAARRIGLEITAEHTAAILDHDADGLHFYTFNDLSTTEELLTALDDKGVSVSSFPPPPPPRRWPPTTDSETTPQKEARS